MKKELEMFVSNVSPFLAQLEGHTFSMGEIPINGVTNKYLIRAVRSWVFLIEDLMISQGLNYESRCARRQNWCSVILANDYSLIKIVDALNSAFSSVILPASSFDIFKQYLRKAGLTEHDCGRLLSPINHALSVFFSDEESCIRASSLRVVSQFCRFLKKLVIPNKSLEDESIKEYLENEERLKSHEYPPDLILDLSNIIQEWFSGFKIDDLLPCHGTGSVAEGPLTLYEKFIQLKVDNTLKVLLTNLNEFQDWKSYFPVLPCDGLQRQSRTVFVPKTITKLRTISMEPIALQYVQQGVMKELYRYIDRHPYLGVRIRLSDQGANQYLAWEGSKCGNFSTIDLSKASDSVAWDLVRGMFKKVPHLYRWLLGTRSSRTLLPDGSVLQLAKFAPMGSALCFPIECIIFASVVEHVSRKCFARYESYSGFYSVYGDDLVVPTAIAYPVMDELGKLGFLPNYEKSYVSGDFRESCGKDYWRGYDVTAVYYRIPSYRKRLSPDAYESYCSAANYAAEQAYPYLRWQYIRCIARYEKCPCFGNTTEASPFLFSSTPTNFHVKKFWSKRYQRWYGKFDSVSLKRNIVDASEMEDGILYFIKQVDMARRSLGDQPYIDESPSSYALHGSVSYFKLTAHPIDYIYREKQFPGNVTIGRVPNR